MAVVLVVEDEVGIAKLLEDVLVDEGHRVILAANGRQALERIAAEQPDLVITDFMMPIMDGSALVKEITANPELTDVPIVMISSLPEATVAERCSRHTHFLRKPFKIFDVIALVERLLKYRNQTAD